MRARNGVWPNRPLAQHDAALGRLSFRGPTGGKGRPLLAGPQAGQVGQRSWRSRWSQAVQVVQAKDGWLRVEHKSAGTSSRGEDWKEGGRA